MKVIEGEALRPFISSTRSARLVRKLWEIESRVGRMTLDFSRISGTTVELELGKLGGNGQLLIQQGRAGRKVDVVNRSTAVPIDLSKGKRVDIIRPYRSTGVVYLKSVKHAATISPPVVNQNKNPQIGISKTAIPEPFVLWDTVKDGWGRKTRVPLSLSIGEGVAFAMHPHNYEEATVIIEGFIRSGNGLCSLISNQVSSTFKLSNRRFKKTIQEVVKLGEDNKIQIVNEGTGDLSLSRVRVEPIFKKGQSVLPDPVLTSRYPLSRRSLKGYSRAAGVDSPVVVSSHNVEFTYEMVGVVPLAYSLYTQGLLKETISGPGSEALYYFSPKHTINNAPRLHSNNSKALQQESLTLPNVHTHKRLLDLTAFDTPPYKEQFANDKYKYKKPIVCICNRYGNERSMEPLNYFSLKCLNTLFNMLKEKYQIVYWATPLEKRFEDQDPSMDLGDYNYVKENHKDVIIFQDIVKDWNETQLQVFANCNKFITMNGGYSVLASYFGGQNIIYSKTGPSQAKEVDVGSFQRWYPEFGDGQVVHTDSYEALYKKVKDLYVDEKPTINILIRTAMRPKFLKSCLDSIEAQNYPNINVVIGVEDTDTETPKYVEKINHRVVFYTRKPKVPKPHGKEYGNPFPFNGFLDDMLQRVEGWVMYLDDDDWFINNNAVTDIVNTITSENDAIFWRVQLGADHNHRVCPRNIGRPVCGDICSIGMLHHTNSKVTWGMFKRGDYRVAKQLYDMCNPIWIDRIYTGVQVGAHGGSRRDKGRSRTDREERDRIRRYRNQGRRR